MTDHRSRDWTDDERAALQDVAAQVRDVIRARIAVADLVRRVEEAQPAQLER